MTYRITDIKWNKGYPELPSECKLNLGTFLTREDMHMILDREGKTITGDPEAYVLTFSIKIS